MTELEMDDFPSKSQKKREADALRKLGVSLIEWSDDKLQQLPLTEQLYRAIREAKSIRSHGAMRRQAQLIFLSGSTPRLLRRGW